MKRKAPVMLLIGALLLVLSATPAFSWNGLTMSGHVSCNENHTQTGYVSGQNIEGQTATVRESSGPVFLVGDTVPSHTTKTESFNKPGDFSGTVTVSIKVNYPGDSTKRSSSVSLHFPGGCVPPPTTTTTKPPPPSTTSTSTTVTESTTTTAPHTTTTCLTDGQHMDCGQRPPDEAPPPTPVPAPPQFTG